VPLELVVWHFQRGDLMATISLQAPASVFKQRLDIAGRIVETIESTGDAPGADAAGEEKSKGTIEYEIEE
jgi:hypothetical protein